MWLVVVFILIGNTPQYFNSIPAESEEQCIEVANISNRIFPNRITVCVYVEESEEV